MHGHGESASHRRPTGVRDAERQREANPPRHATRGQALATRRVLERWAGGCCSVPIEITCPPQGNCLPRPSDTHPCSFAPLSVCVSCAPCAASHIEPAVRLSVHPPFEKGTPRRAAPHRGDASRQPATHQPRASRSLPRATPPRKSAAPPGPWHTLDDAQWLVALRAVGGRWRLHVPASAHPLAVSRLRPSQTSLAHNPITQVNRGSAASSPSSRSGVTPSVAPPI